MAHPTGWFRCWGYTTTRLDTWTREETRWVRDSGDVLSFFNCILAPQMPQQRERELLSCGDLQPCLILYTQCVYQLVLPSWCHSVLGHLPSTWSPGILMSLTFSIWERTMAPKKRYVLLFTYCHPSYPDSYFHSLMCVLPLWSKCPKFIVRVKLALLPEPNGIKVLGGEGECAHGFT